jgi:F0F1-type ATP synthase membrane subunit b/b'
MDQAIINWLFAGFGAAIGWILKVVWDALADLKTDIRAIERDLPEVYVRKDDFKDAVREIKEEMREMRQDIKLSFNKVDDTLNVIFEKINKKEDRNAR